MVGQCRLSMSGMSITAIFTVFINACGNRFLACGSKWQYIRGLLGQPNIIEEDSYLSLGAIRLILDENSLWAAVFTGRCLIFWWAGYLPRKFSPFQFFFGLMGRGEKPPPQFGHTSWRIFSTHPLQNVHSNEQIMASVDSGGNGLLQFSHVGLSSSISSPGSGIILLRLQ